MKRTDQKDTMTDDSQEQPPRSPKETRRLLIIVWALYIAVGVYVIVSALVNPNIVNYLAMAIWIVSTIAQLLFKLLKRKPGSSSSR
jgi:membrane protein YdbS with pleckstrin-like domain